MGGLVTSVGGKPADQEEKEKESKREDGACSGRRRLSSGEDHGVSRADRLEKEMERAGWGRISRFTCSAPIRDRTACTDWVLRPRIGQGAKKNNCCGPGHQPIQFEIAAIHATAARDHDA
ncbi:hypothetical protein VTN96DRAFT_4435 [Rasamsonia emersonii]